MGEAILGRAGSAASIVVIVSVVMLLALSVSMVGDENMGRVSNAATGEGISVRHASRWKIPLASRPCSREAPRMPQAIDRAALDELFDALERRGYTLVGPRVRDRAIVLDEIGSTADLPAGWTDVQEGGTYRLARRDDDALFGHNAGPNSWKSFLFPSELRLWTPAEPPTAASR